MGVGVTLAPTVVPESVSEPQRLGWEYEPVAIMFCQSNCLITPPSLSLFASRRPKILFAWGIVEIDDHGILISIL